MAIRKTGSVTGQVTGTEPAPQIVREASACDLRITWIPEDDQELARENKAADSGDG